MTIVDLKALSKTYDGPPPFEALQVGSLEILEGDYIAVTGPSGSGKSTLLNILGLLDRQTTGTYLLGGTNVTEMSERTRTKVRAERLGFVFQAFHLLPGRTAVDNVALPLIYRRVSARDRRAAASAVLGRVGLSHRVSACPETLSGGERQRVAIARALVGEPDLLLCDEPTGNLDSKSADEILTLLASLHSGGTTIVVITHDEHVAAAAHRRIHIRDGKIGDAAPGGAR